MTKQNTVNRKQRHFDYFKTFKKPSITTMLEEIEFVPYAFSGLNKDSVDTSVTFLNQQFDYPVLISSMTGEKGELFEFNKDLAKLSAEYNIPLATGSIRPMLENTELTEFFDLKQYAEVPFLGLNIGALQAISYGADVLNKALETLKADALFIHINVIQELAQPEGDKDFSVLPHLLDSVIEKIVKPVILKETGSGFDEKSLNQIKKMNISSLETAGAGGSSFLDVEKTYLSPERQQEWHPFEKWGIPTAVTLINAVKILDIPVIASGGIRNGLDIAKSLALGANMAGIAAPFVTSWHSARYQGLQQYMNTLVNNLKTTMMLTGAKDLVSLKQIPLLTGEKLNKRLNAHV